LTTSPALDAHGGPQKRARHRLLTTSRLPLYVGVAFTLTVAFNMTELAVVAFVSGRHASAAAGVVLASWSAGSMLGGLLFAGRAGGADDGAVAASCLAVGASVAVAAAAPGRVGLGVILFTGGMTIAPALGRLYTRVAGVVPEGSTVEAFAWIGVGFLAGSSLGSSLGGLTIDAFGARPTFLFASVAPELMAAVVLVIGRRRASAARIYPLAS
jgi:MFS family permease